MANILVPAYLYKDKTFHTNLSIAFEESILAIDTLENLQASYPDADVTHLPPHSVLYPGFINPHVHLEFSANTTTLRYGEFHTWLDSVIANRDELINKCSKTVMQEATQAMLRSGITTFGAISSYGSELEVCQQTPQRVVFFNELIGSNPQTVDVLYNDFLERLKASTSSPKEANITPAIAIHSPYSVHPIVLNKAVELAKMQNLPLSAHFLESPSEREWLESNAGSFKAFFEKYFETSTPVTTIDNFIEAFHGYPTLFTHVTQATKEEYDTLSKEGHSIIHCPRSNRYLGCGRLAIEALPLPYMLGTDGLSSNDSLNILDEMRAALFMHKDLPLQALATSLIEAVTTIPAKALGMPIGALEVGLKADFSILTLPNAPQDNEDIALWSILHAKEASGVYIEGKAINL